MRSLTAKPKNTNIVFCGLDKMNVQCGTDVGLYEVLIECSIYSKWWSACNQFLEAETESIEVKQYKHRVVDRVNS